MGRAPRIRAQRLRLRRVAPAPAQSSPVHKLHHPPDRDLCVSEEVRLPETLHSGTLSRPAPTDRRAELHPVPADPFHRGRDAGTDREARALGIHQLPIQPVHATCRSDPEISRFSRVLGTSGSFVARSPRGSHGISPNLHRCDQGRRDRESMLWRLRRASRPARWCGAPLSRGLESSGEVDLDAVLLSVLFVHELFGIL